MSTIISKCTKCKQDAYWPVILSCNHYLCISCVNNCVNNKISKCPRCDRQCTNLREIKSKYPTRYF